jgi:hypothetical protein
MLELSGLLLIQVMVMRLCPEIPFSRLLNESLVAKRLTWLATRQPSDLIYFIIVLSMFVAAGDMIAMLGSAELFLVHAADITPYLHGLAVTSVLVAVCRGKVAFQARRAKLSFWHVRALDVSSCPFGKGARRNREGSGSPGNDDDPVPGFVSAA